jgi:hypothetical protein
LELKSLSLQYQKITQQIKNPTEANFRSQQINFYSDAVLKKIEMNSYASNSRRDKNYNLSFANKEKSTNYSKDDLWLISDTMDFKKVEFFTSFYYGCSKSSVEVLFKVYF